MSRCVVMVSSESLSVVAMKSIPIEGEKELKSVKLNPSGEILVNDSKDVSK